MTTNNLQSKKSQKTLKFRIVSILSVMIMTAVSYSGYAQTVFPGKQTIDKKEYLGLILSSNISEKYLSDYWESYLGKYGKVKGKRGLYTIEKAAIMSVSLNPTQLTSKVYSEQKNQSQVFMALYADGNYVGNASDQTYRAAETVLKDFSDFAAVREEVRVADEVFTTTEKNYQKLQRDIEDKTKEIEKTEKKLTELRAEVEKGKMDAANSLVDLQNKQRALESVKVKLSGIR